MTESLADLIRKRDYDEPPEVRVIKDFVRAQFEVNVSVTIQSTQIVINVPNAALAGALRMHLHELKTACGTNKRLVIRIT